MEQAQNSVNSVKKGSKKLIVFIILLVILAGIAGIFYYKYRNGVEVTESLRPPKLFEKGDYKIVTGGDGYVVMVDKVGLTARIPDGWKADFESTSDIDSNEYWVEILSPEADFGASPKKGCKIKVASMSSEESIQAIEEIISQAKTGQYKNEESFFKDYRYDVIQIGGRDVLRAVSPEKPYIGQFIELSFIKEPQNYTQIQVNFLPEYRENCSSSWEDFVESIVIK